MTTLFPLDTVRTRLQLEEGKSTKIKDLMIEICRKEGVAGLYRGLMPVIESLYCSNFVYFYTFHGLKRIANPDNSALKNLVLAMLAGSVNVMTTNPLWVVNTRLKMQGAKSHQAPGHSTGTPHRHYKGMLDGLVKVHKDEGIAGLWSGASSSLILTVNPAIQFMTYEAVKGYMQRLYGTEQLNSLVVFGVGAVAKTVATVLTYPIQLVQAKLRHGHNYPGVSKNAGLWTLLLYILKMNGFKGLFKGLEAKILQTVLTAALMFVAYEKIAAVVFTVLMRGKKVPK